MDVQVDLSLRWAHRPLRQMVRILGSMLLNIHEQWPRPLWGEVLENIKEGCHWSWALNLRHGEERPIHINKNHVCFSLIIDHQLKKKYHCFIVPPLGKKNAYSFSVELYVNKFMRKKYHGFRRWA